MAIDGIFKKLLETPADFETAQKSVVETLRNEFGLSRVTIMLYNKSTNMLESVSAVGVPNIDHRNIRAPVIRIEGISSRAVEARAFLENRPIVIRDRKPDPQYRMRHRFPHKLYSREFAIFPLSVHSRKLGILAISVDDRNPTHLTPNITNKIARLSPIISKIIHSKIPRVQTDRKMAKVMNEIMEEGLLRTVFQPIVDIRKEKIHGFEALLRVNHPLLDGPMMLLGLAEKFNFLRDVSFFSHSNALKYIQSLERGQKMFLNLHPKDFVEYENLDLKLNPFYGQDLSRLVFEITERYYLRDTDRIHSIIKFFKQFGLGIALDDLGSGYSSLEVLTNLEPDYIKLDMSLIRNIHQNDRKQKLIKSLFYYSEQIGCQCVAEGVETKEEYDILESMDCELIQGFFLARPADLPISNREIKKRFGNLSTPVVEAI